MLLFKIPYFHRQALKHAFRFQSKPKGYDLLEQVFIDSEGRRYYRFDNDTDMPFKRLSALQVVMMELTSGHAQKEMKEFLDAMDGALLSLFPQKGQVSGASKIGFIVQEMRWRMDNLIHEDLLFKLAACLYIREDEDPTEVDREIESQKIEQFKKDCAGGEGGTYAFFFQSPLKKHLPYVNISEEEWNQYLAVSKQRIQAMKKMIEGFTSEARSLKG